MTVSQDSGILTIRYDWSDASRWFFLLFSLFWNGTLLVLLFTGAGFFLLFHLLAGVFIAWLTATRFLNHTEITVDRSHLTISHGPVPWPFSKDRSVPAQAIRQLYVSRSATRINEQDTYHLNVKLDTGAEVKLLKSDPDKQKLLNLERTIEVYLDITNDDALDLQPGGMSLPELMAKTEQLEHIRKWLPKSITARMDEAIAQAQAAHNRPPGAGQGRDLANPVAGSPGRDRADVGLPPAALRPRPLPEPVRDNVFPLYRTATGEGVTLDGTTYRTGRTAQLDLTDDDIPQARQIELTGPDGPRYVYAQQESGRWRYWEERRLDDGEVVALGFRDETHPRRFDNGDERYYPRDLQSGHRFAGGNARAITQYIYFSTATATLFRALRPADGGWEVYVMEVVDAGRFAAA